MYLAWATGIDLTVAKLIIALAFAIYVIIGGYSAVVWTDTIQVLILFFGFILMAILAVVHVGGWSAIEQAMDPKAMSLFAIDKMGVLPALSLALVIGVGVLATPSYRQRIYSGKDVPLYAVRLLLLGCYICSSRFCLPLSAWRRSP